MKGKLFLLLLLPLSMAVNASNFLVNINFSYAYGISGFFDSSEIPATVDDLTGIEKTTNRMGFGFGLSANIPIMDRLVIIPGFRLSYGHKNYEFLPDDEEASDIRKNYYFRFYSGELSAAYEILRLKNGWISYVFTGLNYNHVVSDERVNFEKTNILGWQTGIGFQFRYHRHFGFQALMYIRSFFGGDKITYLGLDFGIFYRI